MSIISRLSAAADYVFKMSFTSRVADFAGRLLIGSPRALLYTKKELEYYELKGVEPPDSPNFYLLPKDRQVALKDKMTWQVKRRTIFEDNVRRMMAPWIVFYASVLCVGGAIIQGLASMADGGTAKSVVNILYIVIAVAIVGVIAKSVKDKTWSGLSAFIPLDEIQTKAWQETNAVSQRHDVPHGKNTTPDLDDKEGRFDLTPEGYRVSGRLKLDDMLKGSYSLMAPVVLGLAPLVMGLLSSIAQANGLLAGLLGVCYFVMTIRLVGGGFAFFLALLAGGAVFLSKFVGALAGVGGVSIASTIVQAAIMLALALLPALFWRYENKRRARELLIQGITANAATVGKLNQSHVAARKKQAAAAKNDKTPFIPFGYASGQASGNGDKFAPDPNMLFGYSIKDGGLHTIGFGKSGSGKSSALMGPVAREYLLYSDVAKIDIKKEDEIGVLNKVAAGVNAEIERLRPKMGALILDNKGSLPLDLMGIRSDYVVLEPEFTDVNPLEGLDPEQRYKAFAAVAAEKAEGNKNAYFINNALEYCAKAFHFHYHLSRFERACVEETNKLYDEFHANYTPEEIAGFDPDVIPLKDERTYLDNLQTFDDITDMMSHEPAPGEELNLAGQLAQRMLEEYAPAQSGLLKQACFYIIRRLPAMKPEDRQTTLSSVRSWLSTLTSNSLVLRWLECEHGIDISEVCRGKAYGLNAPDHKYGRAGIVVSNMLKERVYSIIRNRPDMKKWTLDDGWTQVLLAIDECQESISESEDVMFAVARSKGLIGLFACQTITTLIKKMGEDSCKAFLGNITNQICFKSNKATYEHMMNLIGEVEKVQYHSNIKAIDYNGKITQVLTGPEHDPNHPQARTLRGLGRGLWARTRGAFANIFTGLSDFENSSVLNPFSNVKIMYEPLFSPAEISTMLKEPFMALVQVERGSVERRDFVRMQVRDVKTGAVIDVNKIQMSEEFEKDEEDDLETV